MWTRNNREERGTGGPVLRDPIARQQGQPPYNVKTRGNFNPNSWSCNGNSNTVSQNNSHSESQPQFPSPLESAPFPPTPLFNQPPPVSAETTPKNNFFSPQNNPFMCQNAPPPFFNQAWQTAPSSFYNEPPPPNNEAPSPFNQSPTPPAYNQPPTPPAFNQHSAPPAFSQHPTPPAFNQYQSPTVSSSPLSARLLSLANSTSQSQSPAHSPLTARAQQSSPSPLMSISVPQPPPLASPSFSGEFNSQFMSKQIPPRHQTPPPKPMMWGSSIPSLGTSGGSYNDSPASPFNTPKNHSFGNGNSPFTQQQQQQQQYQQRNRPTYSEPHQRPSSFLPNPMYSRQNDNSNGQQVRRNNFVPPNRTTLLPTPKLVPYPPPPKPESANTQPTSILRNPRGLSQETEQYSNFVRQKSSASSNNSNNNAETGHRSLIDSDTFRRTPVVPYGDDDEDEDFLLESGKTGEAAEEPHDFFSEKMVQHFASILNEKDLDVQMQQLMSHILLPSEYLGSRVNIVRNVHSMLKQGFQKSNIYPYGADFIGIGNSDDSVNIFIDLTGNQGPSPNIESTRIEPSEPTEDNVEQLLGLIQKDENHKFFGQIVRRTNLNYCRANLPVISFIHSETQVRCNLRLDNYLLVQEAKVIQFICSLDTRICPLLALVRYWSSVHKVLDTPAEDTKNRFVTFLVLFFLARKNIIPTMAHLQSLGVKHEYFENIDISFCDDYSLVPRNENPALDDKTVFSLSTIALLKEFFRLFAEVKFEDQVVSLWKAEFIPKEHFNQNVEAKVLPPDLRKRYIFGVDGKIRGKRLDCGSRLCIQDFQDLTENLSLAVADYDVSKFQFECEVALKKIETIMACGSGNLMDLFVLSDYST